MYIDVKIGELSIVSIVSLLCHLAENGCRLLVADAQDPGWSSVPLAYRCICEVYS